MVLICNTDYKCGLGMQKLYKGVLVRLRDMFDIRNKWAHMDSNLPDKAEIKDDFYTIADFMTQIRCSRGT